MPRNFVLVLIAGYFCLNAYAANKPNKDEIPPPVDPKVLAPRLSKAGIQRVNKNINTLEQNLRDIDYNVNASWRNIKTLRDELDTLDSLEREHKDLKQKYVEYLADAQKKVSKNDQQLKAFSKYEKESESSKKGNSARGNAKETTSKSALEKAQLVEWKNDANQKVKKINDLLKETQYNMGQIQGRRDVLRSQLNTWNERLKEFQELETNFKTKKAELEKLLEK